MLRCSSGMKTVSYEAVLTCSADVAVWAAPKATPSWKGSNDGRESFSSSLRSWN